MSEHKMPVHLLIETGRASRLAACDEPFANGQWGSEDIADVTCRACLALFPSRGDAAMSEHTAENDAPGFRWSTATADQRAACAAGGAECPDCAAQYVIPPVVSAP